MGPGHAARVGDYAGAHVGSDKHPNTHADTDSHAVPGAHVGSDKHPNTHADTGSHAVPGAHVGSDKHPNTNTNTHAHAASGFLRLRQRRSESHLRSKERRLRRLLGQQ